MKMSDLYWADSDIEKIIIEFNKLKMFVFNDFLQKNVVVVCNNFIGMDNFCIWDDTIISQLHMKKIDTTEMSRFAMLSHYDLNFDYGNRYLSDGMIDISVELTNQTVFHIYCQNVMIEINE